MSKKERIMGYKELESLIKKNPSDILLTLRSKKSGFMNLFSQKFISKDKMALILTALGKACQCEERCSLNYILKSLDSSNDFKFVHLQKFLCNLQNNDCNDFHIESLNFLTDFLLELQRVNPASDMLGIILPILKYTQERIAKRGKNISSTLEEKIKELEEENEKFHELNLNQVTETLKPTFDEVTEPPDDFRQIPVLPLNRESFMEDQPFLRPIIQEGSYINVDHYLDIQFRLLREDILQPLRNGIGEYITAINQGDIKIYNKNLRLYRNVFIKKPVMSASGLNHLISFDIKYFKNIFWENSKRLLFGSLLCLSQDNFQSMIFATVTKRNPEKLKKGELEVQFENVNKIFDLEPNSVFVMVESDAYFEAYRHIMTALQETTEDTLPLKEYIIKCKKEVNAPSYLKKDSCYDFRSLVCHDDNFDHSVELDYAKNVNVLNTKNWPSKEKMGLDESQIASLKSAMTKEIAIIQGPPGTGKTFIGLKIVQLLLDNCNNWNPSGKLSPILIICYTNHALDQFLEGILHFTNSIVRVGGRSANPLMSAYQLTTLRQNQNKNHTSNSHLFHNIIDTKLQLKDIQRRVISAEKKLEYAAGCILPLSELKEHMREKHFCQFHEDVSNKYFDNNAIISEWLKLNNCLDVIENEMEQELHEKSSADMKDFNQEEIGDIDYIINERMIEDDDIDIDNTIVESLIDSSTKSQSEEEQNRDELMTTHITYKQRLAFVNKQLQQTDIMTKKEENDCKDIYNINIKDRWRIYRLWVVRFIQKYIEEIKTYQTTYKENMQEYSEFKLLEDIELMKHAKIVGMTTTGASKYRTIVQKLQPQIIIVEEAAEVLEAHIVASLNINTQHLILIGDHKQLRPSPTVYDLAKRYNLDLSFFERMIKNGVHYERLKIQHRMRPCISALLVPHFYKNLVDDISVKKYENIKGMDTNMFFICHDYPENIIVDSNSKSNTYEAEFINGLCKHLILQGYKPSQITILTMYTGQLFLLKKKMSPSCKDVRITVVDNYQGEENDIILISFVRSNKEGNIGFLKVNNRICVALSRAKKGLYCIGNFDVFAENNMLWKNIIENLRENHYIGYKLKLKCENHPTVRTEIVRVSDFVDKVPEGGCHQYCNYRLECGHSCTIFCHPYDETHRNFKCKKPCERILCDYGHKCKKKCFENCGSCLELVPKRLPGCKHIMKIPCYKNPEDIDCDHRYQIQLLCGHFSEIICGHPNPVCHKLILCQALCGHNVKIECVNSQNEWKKLKMCEQKCNKELECEHLCKGKCNQCNQGRLHITCEERCKRILVCGHECKFPCAKNCPPCKMKCENRCNHSCCPKKCGQQCQRCKEKCNWKCNHYACTQLCGEMCDRPPCNKPCQKKLKCRHKCIGLCGEPCPNLCRICDKDKVTEIFFGTEDEHDARFIKLEDCNHIFEVNGFTQYLETRSDSTEEIQMKSCPMCKKVIRKNLRFGNYVKSCLENIERVKEKVRGSDDNNETKRLTLIEKIDKFQIVSENVILDAIVKLQYPLSFKIDDKVICRVTSNISNVLRKEKQIHTQLLNTIENFLIFLEDIFNFCNNLLPIYNNIQKADSQIKDIQISFICEFVLNSINIILQTMEEKAASASYQLLTDLSQEINRLKLFSNLFRFTVSYRNDEKFKKCYSQAVKMLTTFKSFDNKIYETAKKKLNELRRCCDGAILGISEEERRQITKAMDLRQGHWYQCPNGHVYCITECGGAMQEGRCNECQATIGGSRHQLRQDNRLAGVMDGARHPAWSEHANLNNFILDDFLN